MQSLFAISIFCICGCNDKSQLSPETQHLADQYHMGCQQYVASSSKSAGVQPHATESCYRIPHRGDKGQDVTLTIYYVRHAQSEWNKAREDNPGARDNVRFRDALLTSHGINQAMELNEAIVSDNLTEASEEDKRILKGEDGNMMIVTSNLRRAALTLLVAFRHLFKLPPSAAKNEIKIVSALQEKSTTIDSLTLSGKGEIPYITFAGSPLLEGEGGKDKGQCPYTYSHMASIMKPECNDGDEIARNEDTILNMCSWLRNQVRANPNLGNMLIVGHGNFIKKFFRALHPKLTHGINREDIGEIFATSRKTTALNNASILKFKLLVSPPVRGSIHARCRIIQQTTKLIAGSISN